MPNTDVTANLFACDDGLKICHGIHSGNVLFHVPLVSGVTRLFQSEVIETVTNHSLRVVRNHVAHANKVKAYAAKVVLLRNRQHFWECIQGHKEVFSCLLLGARTVRHTVLNTGDHALIELLRGRELQRIQFIIDVRCV